MTTKSEPTYWLRIYVSGPIEIAKQVCREFCMTGLCVTIEPTLFIYTGGEEIGYVVGIINYPRFPSNKEDLFTKAQALTEQLIEKTFQHSALIMTPDGTHWFTKRDQSKV